MPQRFWTAKEREFLAANVGRMSYKEMARALGRSRISVKGALRRYRLTAGRSRDASPWQDKLRSMVQRGLLDPEIRALTGWSRSTVWRRRTALGIKGLTKNVKWAGKLRMLHAKGLTDSQIATRWASAGPTRSIVAIRWDCPPTRGRSTYRPSLGSRRRSGGSAHDRS